MLPGAHAAGRNSCGRAPDRGGEVGVAATRASRIAHRVVDQRRRKPAVVARRADGRDCARRLVDHQHRNVVARFVVEPEGIVPRLATHLIEVTVDRRFLRDDLRLREAAHQRGPLRPGVEIHQQHAVGDLEAGSDRVWEVAARLDAVEQAGKDRGGSVLLDRAARAAVAQRVRDLAVRIDDVLFHHHQRLGVQDPVRVEERVRETVVDDHEAARERRVIGPVLLAAELQPRLSRRRAEAVDNLAVPLRLRRQRRPGHCAARVEQHGDVVDAAIQRSALDTYDVRHRDARRGRRGRKIGRRGADCIGFEARVRRRGGGRARVRQRGRATRGRRAVEQLVLGCDVALRIDGEGRQAARVRRRRVARFGDGRGRRADPRRRLRAQQHRSADRVVGDFQPRLGFIMTAAAGLGDEFVVPIHEAGRHAPEGMRGRPGPERRGDHPAVEPQGDLVQRDVLRYAHLEQRVAPAHEIGAVRQRHDLEIGRVLSRLRGNREYRAERQERRLDEVHGSSSLGRNGSCRRGSSTSAQVARESCSQRFCAQAGEFTTPVPRYG